MMNTILRRLSLAILGAMIYLQSHAHGATAKPNIVFFLVDDMGWMDCGAYGSQYYKTPNMDRLATQSMRFLNAYAQPLCSPTRASILSGQHSARHGMTTAGGHTPPREAALAASAPASQPLLMPESKTYLDPEQYTLAEALHDAGYRTAHIGKWHCGLTQPHWPEQQGFDVAFHAEPSPGPPSYFSPYGVVPPGTLPDRKKGENASGSITDGPSGEYITDRITDEAIKFIKANKDRPFFLNLWQFGVHGPWGHKEAYTAEFAKTTDPRGVQGNPIMASMLKSVDESLGRVLAVLDELKLTENTIVVFYSDNGGNVHSNTSEDGKQSAIKPGHPRYEAMQDWRKWAGDRPPTSNLPLRDGKGKMYEGGVRVPLMVRWPGKIPAGTTSDAIVGCIDMYPTLLELAGVTVSTSQKIDGISFAPVLRQTGAFSRDTYYIWFPHLVPGVSVRKGEWKLIRRFIERPSDFEGLRELFNLKDDPGEKNNLATRHPEIVQELDALIDQFVKDTGAIYPQPNPAHKPRAASASQAPVDPMAGLMPKRCKATVLPDALRVEADGQAPFLGTAQVKGNGPLIMKLRARSLPGGPGKVQWSTKTQTAVPETGQTVGFVLPPGKEWQDVNVTVPIQGASGIIRVFLPADKAPVEIESIRFFAGGSEQPVHVWNFNRGQ